MRHSKLPWETSSLIHNFVPRCMKLFNLDAKSVFIAWRGCECVVFTFSESPVSTAASTPTSSLALRTSEEILDVVEIESCIFFVSVGGLVQALHPSEKSKSSNENQFRLIDVHQLSPLKKVLALCEINEKKSTCDLVNLCVVTLGKDSSELHVELYAVSWSQCKAGFKLLTLYTVPYKASSEIKRRACVLVHCSKQQVKMLFQEYIGFEVLLLGLPSGHLFSVPYNTSTHYRQHTPPPRLMYQSPLAICGVFCPKDGNVILLTIDGGILIAISSTSLKQKVERTTPLNYNTITLPCPMKHICALRSNLILCSNGVDLWKLQSLTSEFSDVVALPLKGVTAMYKLNGTSVIAATMYCMFYILDTSAEPQIFGSKKEILPSLDWSGVSLDKPLQYVREMKEQTELLACLRMQQEAEDTVIAALSTVARVHLLVDLFCMSVKVDIDSQSPSRVNCEKDNFSPVASNFSRKYQFLIEILNKSTEEFASSLWGICVEIENPQGKVMSRYEPLMRSFTSDAPFITVIPITLSSKEIAVPIKVKAHLLAILTDGDIASEWQWLSIPLGETCLDVSYFIIVETQAPAASFVETDPAGLLGKMNIFSTISKKQEDDMGDKYKVVHNVFLPEPARHIPLLVRKLLENCQHRIDINALEKHIVERTNDCSIWIGVSAKFAQITFKKYCTSLSISCENTELLHLVKSWIVAVILCITKSRNVSNNVIAKAKNLKAVLEMEHFEEEENCNRLLTVYQELRNSVSFEVL